MADTYWLMYLAQNGHNVRVNMTDDDAKKVQHHIHHGIPFGVWFDTDAGRLTGITVNPVQGGLVLNLDPAQPIPLDEHGQPTDNPQAVKAWVKVEDQPIGKIYLPAWANVQAQAIKEEIQERTNGNGEHVTGPPPEPKPETVKPATPPPGPPGQAS